MEKSDERILCIAQKVFTDAERLTAKEYPATPCKLETLDNEIVRKMLNHYQDSLTEIIDEVETNKNARLSSWRQRIETDFDDSEDDLDLLANYLSWQIRKKKKSIGNVCFALTRVKNCIYVATNSSQFDDNNAFLASTLNSDELQFYNNWKFLFEICNDSRANLVVFGMDKVFWNIIFARDENGTFFCELFIN